MSSKENPQEVINKFSKRQRIMPYLLGGLAGLLAVVGIILIISVATGSGNIFKSIFATKTPTPTATFTPTATVPSPTPSMTPTSTLTPTATLTVTPSGPQYYTVQQNDDCWTIASTFGVDLLVLLAINNFQRPHRFQPGCRGDLRFSTPLFQVKPSRILPPVLIAQWRIF